MHSKFFSGNRKKLLERLAPASLLLLFSNDSFPKNGDQNFSFRQQSDLYYFSGICQEKTSLILYKDAEGNTTEILSILKPNVHLETWEGKKLSVGEAQSISGVEQIIWNEERNHYLSVTLPLVKNIYLLNKDAYSVKHHLATYRSRFYDYLFQKYQDKHFVSPRAWFDEMRLVKQTEEIEAIRQAIAYTKQAYNHVLRNIIALNSEYEVEAEIAYQLAKQGIKNQAYPPIVACGVNACSLHYNQNNAVFGKKELLLMDFGADNEYYAADLSRTIPVSGRFTERQKDLYNIVLKVQKEAIKLCVPGNTIELINAKSRAYMATLLLEKKIIDSSEELAEVFPHGTCHFLGIDVHDVGTKQTLLKEGMVLTCEPGIYIKEEKIGIRIEDNILVGRVPRNLMEGFLTTVEELESFVNV